MGFDPRSVAVYVVTTGTLVPGRDHREIGRAAIEGGATGVQLRAPELDVDDLEPLATEMAGWCRDAGVLFIVNDRLEVAVSSGSHGVHLGQEDAFGKARQELGAGRVLGVSVDTPAQARVAAEAGADYLGVTVFATPTKADARPVGLQGLSEVAGRTDLPVVAIGGMNAGNARDVLAAGAAGVAVVSAVAAAPDPVEATRELRLIVDRYLAEEESME